MRRAIVLAMLISQPALADECVRPAAKKQLHVELVAPVDVETLMRALSAITCEQYVVPPALAHRVVAVDTSALVTARELDERARASSCAPRASC
jgi:hypothetical protein